MGFLTLPCLLRPQDVALEGVRRTRASVQYKHTVKFTSLKDDFVEEEIGGKRGKDAKKDSGDGEVRMSDVQLGCAGLSMFDFSLLHEFDFLNSFRPMLLAG